MPCLAPSSLIRKGSAKLQIGIWRLAARRQGKRFSLGCEIRDKTLTYREWKVTSSAVIFEFHKSEAATSAGIRSLRPIFRRTPAGAHDRAIRAVHNNGAPRAVILPRRLSFGFWQQQVANNRVFGDPCDHQFTGPAVFAAVKFHGPLDHLIVDPDGAAVGHEEHPSLKALIADVRMVDL